MSPREQVARYLTGRVRAAFTEGDTKRANSFDRLLGVVERMTDDEYNRPKPRLNGNHSTFA